MNDERSYQGDSESVVWQDRLYIAVGSVRLEVVHFNVFWMVQIPPGPPIDEPANFPALSSIMVSFALWMKKKPYREATIRSTLSCVKSIARRSILDSQESVREYIATANVSAKQTPASDNLTL